MSSQPTATPAYDRFYYLRYLDPDGKLEYARSDHWLQFFGYIAERIAVDIQPASILDAGCAMGMIVECLRDRGIEAFGIDISEYALANVRDDIQPYCASASVTEPLPRRYELITCIETLEHLQPVDAERAVANLCGHTDDVVFSSTPSHFKETTHLNVHPPEYSAELFARYGLYRAADYDPSTYIARGRCASDAALTHLPGSWAITSVWSGGCQARTAGCASLDWSGRPTWPGPPTGWIRLTPRLRRRVWS